MVDHQSLQRGVALLRCGREQGSATIISSDIAVATRHSLIDHLDNPDVPIELILPGEPNAITAVLHDVVIPDEEDVAILRLQAAVDQDVVVDLSATHLPVGVQWEAFGFPSLRSIAGTWIRGAVANWLPQGGSPQDVELSVSEFQAFRSYRGFSGAPIWVGNKAVAILQRQLDGALAATSVLRLRRYLDLAGVRYQSAEGARSIPEALRKIVDEAPPNARTYWAFENALHKPAAGYIVLCGAPGSGKTVIAAGFTPSDPRKRIIGTYFAGGDGDPAPLPPELHRNPRAFASWLARETALVTGKAVPSAPDHGITEHAKTITHSLTALGNHYASQGLLGVLIIDDVCGATGSVTDAALGHVLPATPPPGLALALTAASEAAVRTASPHLALAAIVPVAPLELFDCERIVAAALKGAVQSSDVLRIASAAEGNPLILSYLVREAQNAIAAGLALPEANDAVPTAQEFYHRQWARLSANDVSVWIVALVARLRGGMPASEIPRVLPESCQAGFPSAWRAVRHFFREDNDGIQVFHGSFREFVLAQTPLLNDSVHDRLAEYCATAASGYGIANVVYHHVRGSSQKQLFAAGMCTQAWLDTAAVQCVPPAYVLADVEDLLRLATTRGSFEETIRLLLLRSRIRFRYDRVFGQCAVELAGVVSHLRGPSTALRFVIRDQQLLCSPAETVDLIRRLVLREQYAAACELYQALRRHCVAEYEGGGFEVSSLTSHLEAFGILLRELGPGYNAELRILYRFLDKVVFEDGRDDVLFKARARGLPFAAHLWRWGWFSYSVHSREQDPARYATELACILDYAYNLRRIHGSSNQELDAPQPTEFFKIFSADIAAAEVETFCQRNGVLAGATPFVIDVLIRHSRDPAMVAALAASLPSPEPIRVRRPNGVDFDDQAIDTLLRWNTVASYTSDTTILGQLKIEIREAWEHRFLDAFSWLGTTYGRLCRAQRESLSVDIPLAAEFLPLLTFSLAERAYWQDSYNLPEAMLPLLFAKLCELLARFAPDLAGVTRRWALDRLDDQLGVYTEGCTRALWELAEGLDLCDTTAARDVWRAHLEHVLKCTSNRLERVPALLIGAQGAADSGAAVLAEESFLHAVKASMGPSWYKEDQFTLLVDTLNAAGDPAISGEHWREVAGLLEHASGDLTFQQFVRYEKESLVRHLSNKGRTAEALALIINYLWPDETTQLGRIKSWRADRLSPLKGGRFGVMEIDPQAGALALLAGLGCASPLHRWALVELFLPGDDRHHESFAKVIAELLDSQIAEVVNQRLEQLLIADFVPAKRAGFIQQLRCLSGSTAATQWVQDLERKYDWAHRPSEEEVLTPPRVAPRTVEAQITGGALKPEGQEQSSPVTKGTVAASPDDFMFMPGTFGKRHGLRALEDALRAASERMAAGDTTAARDIYAEGLAAAQDAGWGIWEGSSNCRSALRSIFSDTADVAAAIRTLQPLILKEEYAEDWQVAEAMIEAGLPGRPALLVARVIEEVFAHTHAILGPEMEWSVDYEALGLADISEPETPERVIEHLLLSALDDANLHFRERAANILRWLLDSEPTFDLDALLGHATGAVGRHSREICLGIIHAWVMARPLIAVPAVTARPAFAQLQRDPSFAARYVSSAIRNAGEAQGSQDATPAEPLASRLNAADLPQRSWRWQLDCAEVLRIAGDARTSEAALRHLFDLCSVVAPSEAVGLWRLRQEAVASGDFWSSAWEREAVFRAVSDVSDARAQHLADELMWNPLWPDATLRTDTASICDGIFERVRREQYDDCFVVDDRLLLHCREATYDERTEGTSRLEIVALLVPSAFFTGDFDRGLLFERRSIHGWTVHRSGLIVPPVEPAVAKFNDRYGRIGGSMTPATPSQKLLELTRAADDAFVQASWRSGRAWEPFGVGRPLHEGTLLTMDSTISLGLSGMDLVWCLLRDEQRVALVDPARRRSYIGENL